MLTEGEKEVVARMSLVVVVVSKEIG